MKKTIVMAAILVAASTFIHADTSYLLIQGGYGSGGATDSFKWQVNYPAAALSTSQDLLNAVFGTPTDTGTTFHTDFGNYEKYSAGTAQQGVSYINFGTSANLSLFTISFTLKDTATQQTSTLLANSAENPGWNFYVAGGAYPSDSWSYSNDGLNTRQLANNSFDGWVFGSTGTYDTNFNQLTPPDTIAGSGNTPITPNFAGATVVNVVPEPHSVAFLLIGLASLAAWIKRSTRPAFCGGL